MNTKFTNGVKKKMLKWLVNFLQDETGDTNFISILIVLGIVIVLVVFFQDQILNIIGVVQDQVSQFTGFSL